MSSRLLGFLLLLLLSALVTSGCGRASVSTVVSYPAVMPLRVYPVVLVAFGNEPYAAEAAARVEAHLRAPLGSSLGVDARRMPREDVERLIATAALQPGTAVVEVSSVSSVRVTTVPRTINYQDCSFGRCITRMRTDYVDEAVLTLMVSLAVRDIRTGQVLHRVREGAELVGGGRRAENALLERVMRLLLPYLDQRSERVRVRLLRVRDERVQRAVALMHDGEWRAGRVLLEEAARSTELAALSPELRARALYDLSVARRFDPTTRDDVARHYASAKAALAAAMALDPDEEFYRDALRALEADEARATALVAQQRAASDNASVPVENATVAPLPTPEEASRGDVPAPPPGYR